MAGLAPAGVPLRLADFPNLQEWMGARLWKYSMANDVFSYPDFESAVAVHALPMADAAAADAEDFETNKELTKAVKCYQFAVNMVKQARLVDVNLIIELSCKLSSVLVKVGDFQSAYLVSSESIILQPNLPAYQLMSVATEGLGSRAMAACNMLGALESCQLKEEEAVDVIVRTSQLVAMLVLDVGNGKDIVHETNGIEQLRGTKPELPRSQSAWDRITQQLFTSCSFSALALPTVGLPGGHISHLNSFARDIQIDCSQMDVERMYETLAESDVEMWGDALAVFIVDHGGGVGRQTQDPLGAHLVKLALKHKSLEFFQHVLRTWGTAALNVNGLDSQGNTPVHLVVKACPLGRFHQHLISLLMKHGALTNTPDKNGKTPEEYVDKTSVIFRQLHGAVGQDQAEGLVASVQSLKAEGKKAVEAGNYNQALDCYVEAALVIQRSQSQTRGRELAVLYSNQSHVYSCLGNATSARVMARKSIEQDPSYHKSYWRLGKILLQEGCYMEACEQLLCGAGCVGVPEETQFTFLLEICRSLSSLTDQQAESVVEAMQPFLSGCWPRLAENLTQNSLWEEMCRLVLGPPELVVDRAAVPEGWRFADRYKEEGEVKVGYAMCLKATTHNLSTLTPAVENKMCPKIDQFATDLVLALLLQGARLESLADGLEDTTCYHAAVSLCCQTEKLGLLRYILSDVRTLALARQATDQEKRTLLHAACLHFGDGTHPVGQLLARLFMETGFSPETRDMLNKKAEDYLAPRSPMARILTETSASSLTAEELSAQGSKLFKRKEYQAAAASFSQAIQKLFVMTPPLEGVQDVMGKEQEMHQLAVLFANRAQCFLKLQQMDEAFSDAKSSVAWDGHWHKGHLLVGRALVYRQKHRQASRAFFNAYSALPADCSEKMKTEALKELTMCLVQTTDEPPELIARLRIVPADLWMKAAYSYFCEGNCDIEKQCAVTTSDPWLKWKAGRYAVRLTSTAVQNNFGQLFDVKVNLKPLCSWRIPQEFLEALDALLVFLISSGSDYRTLSFYNGDTYVHAAVCFTLTNGDAGFLDFIMKRCALPAGQESLRDVDGNTALHLIALPVHRCLPDLSTDCRHSMLKILLDYGVDPSLRNKRGKIALECLSSDAHHTLRTLLQEAAWKG